MRQRNKQPITAATIMLDKEQATTVFNLGWMTIDKIAVEVGAKVHVGKRVLYHRGKLQEYFDSLVK